jgi:hypothetical protein
MAVDGQASGTRVLQDVYALCGVHGDLQGFHKGSRRIATAADGVQEDAVLGVDGDTIVAAVGYVQAFVERKSEAFRVFELAVAAPAATEYA